MSALRTRDGATYRLYLASDLFSSHEAFREALVALEGVLPVDGTVRVTIGTRAGAITGHWAGLAGTGASTLLTLAETSAGLRSRKAGGVAALLPDVVSFAAH